MYDHLGRVAAGTLGYIHGNAKGAVSAYKGYDALKGVGNTVKKLAKSLTMPAMKRKGGSKASGREKKIKHKHGLRDIATGVRRTGKVIKKAGFSHPRNSTTASKSRKRVKGVDFKKGKKVKVSKDFKKKVDKVMAGHIYQGYYQSVFYGQSGLDQGNAQTVFYPDFDGLNNGFLFTGAQFLNAASILWNGKPVPTAGPLIGDALNFDKEQTKMRIRRSWAVMQIRNNSQRTQYLKMFECKPKSMQNQADPLQQWAATLLEMQNSGAGTPFGENALNTATGTLHADPKSLKSWNKWWSAEVTKYVLDPGQVVDYVINGPSDMDIDLAKFYNGVTYNSIQKQGRYVFGVVYGDLTSTTLAGQGRAPENAITGAGYDLVYECNTYYAMEQPDKAGIVGPAGAAGVGTPLQERHNAYSIYVSPYIVSGSAIRVDEENPALTTFT